MLFRRGVVKAPGLLISDREDFTDSSRRQRQSTGQFCIGPVAPPRPHAGTPLSERLGSLCPSPCEMLWGCLGLTDPTDNSPCPQRVPRTLPVLAPRRVFWLPLSRIYLMC